MNTPSWSHIRTPGFKISLISPDSRTPCIYQKNPPFGINLTKLGRTSWAHEWLIIRDFNVVLDEKGKYGWKSLNAKEANAFLDSIDNLNMIDLGSVGMSFTWSNKWKGLVHAKDGLDNAIGYNEWRLKLTRISPNFRFHNMWFREAECVGIIKNRCVCRV